MGSQQTWLRRVSETFWVLPAAVIALAIAFGTIRPAVDRSVTLPDWLALSSEAETARAVLTAIVALTVSVAGVSFSVIVVALILASQQLSPRVLRSFQRQRLNQAVLALLLGSATYALFVLGFVSEEQDRSVSELSVTIAMGLAAASLGLFVVFLHHAVRSLNASAVIRRIAAEGHASIAEYIASVDGDRIVEWAAANDAFVEQRRGVGTSRSQGRSSRSCAAPVVARSIPAPSQPRSY